MTCLKRIALRLSERLLQGVRKVFFSSEADWYNLHYPALAGYRRGNWLVDGMPVHLSQDCVRRHTLVTGSDAGNVQHYLQFRMGDAMRRKKGLLFIDCKGSLATLEPMKAAARECDCEHQVRVLNFCGDPAVSGFRFNPLANWSPRLAADWMDDLFDFRGRFQSIMPAVCCLRDQEGLNLDIRTLLRLCEIEQLKSMHVDERIPHAMRELLGDLLLELEYPHQLNDYVDDLQRLNALAYPMLTTYAEIFDSHGNCDSGRLDLSGCLNEGHIIHASFMDSEPGNITTQALFLALKWEAIGIGGTTPGYMGYEGAVIMLNDFQHHGILKRAGDQAMFGRKYGIEMIYASDPSVFERGGMMDVVLENTSTRILLADDSEKTPEYFWSALINHNQKLEKWPKWMSNLQPGEAILFSFDMKFNTSQPGVLFPQAERIRF